jgi:hypothetical protein
MAFMNGLSEIGSTILEPLLKIRITAPEDLSGKIFSEIIKMGGEYDSPVIHSQIVTLEAIVPVATSMDFPSKLAVISSGVLRKKWYTIFIFCWSAAVAYSRVYVGKHFPGDVICGAMFGALVGYIILLVFRKIVKKYNLPQDAVHK